MELHLYEYSGLLLGRDVHLVITPWKLYGFVGVAIFASRWFVQMYASRKAGRPVMTRTFWLMSLLGSLILLSYFIFSPKQDAVGVLSNLFPAFVAAYNLYLDIRYHQTNGYRIEAPALAAPGGETLWTIAATCRQQGRSLFRYLVDAVSAHFAQRLAPSLLRAGP